MHIFLVVQFHNFELWTKRKKQDLFLKGKKIQNVFFNYYRQSVAQHRSVLVGGYLIIHLLMTLRQWLHNKKSPWVSCCEQDSIPSIDIFWKAKVHLFLNLKCTPHTEKQALIFQRTITFPFSVFIKELNTLFGVWSEENIDGVLVWWKCRWEASGSCW